MKKKRRVSNILFGASLISAVFMVWSGLTILFSFRAGDTMGEYKQIVLKSYDQENEITALEDTIFPSESKSFKVEIKSKLSENCYYSISVINHTKTSDDKMFLISAYTDSKNFCTERSLADIVTSNHAFATNYIGSYATESVYLEFKVSEELTKSVDFSFDILVKAEGKLSY